MIWTLYLKSACNDYKQMTFATSSSWHLALLNIITTTVIERKDFAANDSKIQAMLNYGYTLLVLKFGQLTRLNVAIVS